MADNFGQAQNGRAQVGGRFYAKPVTDVPANTIYMPAYASSALLGINEIPIASGQLGAFSTEGVFAFDIPDDWTSSVGQIVYYKPTSATEGTISATKSSGAVRLGYEVEEPGVTGKLCVYLAPNEA